MKILGRGEVRLVAQKLGAELSRVLDADVLKLLLAAVHDELPGVYAPLHIAQAGGELRGGIGHSLELLLLLVAELIAALRAEAFCVVPRAV